MCNFCLHSFVAGNLHPAMFIDSLLQTEGRGHIYFQCRQSSKTIDQSR